MNFKKENLKEVTTTDSVTDLVIFEKGDSTPKRIKKSNFNGGLSYKSYVALLTQSGTNPPVATVLYNDLGADVTYGYNQVGDYTFSSTAFTEGKTTVFIGQAYDSNATTINYAYMTAYPDGAIFTAADNIGANDYLYTTPFEIKVYS